MDLSVQQMMKPWWMAIAALCVSLPVWAQAPKPAAAPAADSSSLQIAYVDGQRIEGDTRRAWEISELLRRELGTREQEVHEMEARVKSMQAQLSSYTQPRERDLKEREFQQQAQRLKQMGRAFVDDLERRKAEERRKYFTEVTAVVQKIAEARKYDLVVQEAIFAGKAIDITDDVVKALGGPAPSTPGAAPAAK
jgi:outer membrane protein